MKIFCDLENVKKNTNMYIQLDVGQIWRFASSAASFDIEIICFNNRLCGKIVNILYNTGCLPIEIFDIVENFKILATKNNIVSINDMRHSGWQRQYKSIYEM